MGRISWKMFPEKKENEKPIYTGYHSEVNTDNNNEALYYLKPYTFNANDWAITWFSCVYKIHAFSMTSLQSHVYMQNSLLVESVAWCVFFCLSSRLSTPKREWKSCHFIKNTCVHLTESMRRVQHHIDKNMFNSHVSTGLRFMWWYRT